MDPLAGSPWSAPRTVEGFARGEPNPVLMDYASHVLQAQGGRGVVLDIGCGAGRNAVPLARQGWRVLGTDLSWPMLEAARRRAAAGEAGLGALHLALAPMTHLPAASASFDLIVAHGIWNLAPSSDAFRRGVREAARAARSGAALFVFTFSRQTLPPDAEPVPGERFVFTQFSGAPQCFLTEAQLTDELRDAGFARDGAVPLTEYNRPAPGSRPIAGGPVIYEAAFRRTGP